MSWFRFLLRRHAWLLVRIAVVGVCSGLVGRASAHLVEAKYLVSDEAPPALRRWTKPAPTPSRTQETNTIVERDVFCSRCPGITAKRAEEKKELAAPTGPRRSSLPLSLGAVVITGDQASSIAVGRDTVKPRPQPAAWFHCGEPLFATGAILQRIEERRVYLRNGEQLEFLDLDDPAATTPAAKPAPGAQHRDALSAEIDQGVRCNGGACQVDRSLVNELLANTSLLASSARFVPAMQGGRPNGFRVYAIHPGSLFDKLGMQNGDRVVSINGLTLATPDQALGIYSKLRNASHLSMQLDRHGSLTMLDYVIL